LSVRHGLRRPWAKPLIGVVLLWPLAYLLWGAAMDALGPNPAEALIRSSGEMALRTLCVALAVTPLRVISGWPEWARFRRMAGLIAFTYAVFHLLCYSWLDMGLDVADIARDIAKRPFILVGMLTFGLMLALAATSFNAAIKRLGARRWQALHRIVYAAALLAVLHFYWMRSGKNNFGEVAVYGGIVAALLIWRLWRRWQGRVKARTTRPR
jgi:sulfoxide reductase heme-binding subunit YedZ